MRTNYTIFYCLIILLITIPVSAVNTTKIDAVRSKETLADIDTAVIEEFLSDAFSELVSKTDFSDIASLRNTIVNKSTSASNSGQILYGPKFTSAVQKELNDAFTKVNALPDNTPKTILITNLLILINDLGNIEISKMAIDYIQADNAIIRYWAVSSVSNANVISQLNSSSEERRRLAQDIAQKLLKIAQTEQSSDILILLAQFASKLNQPTANDILTAVAQKRIDLYSAWKVNDETTDSWILQSLAERTQLDTDSVKPMMKNFASLYSLMIQRYVLGEQILTDINKSNLVSAISQSEKFLPRFIPDWSGNFKRAIEKGGAAILTAEADGLFGSAGAAGRLPTTVGFDYGKNPDGSVKNTPPVLQKPQAAKTAN